ncbi:hypothetical protein HN51_031559, partial [Arachis hypogaea]
MAEWLKCPTHNWRIRRFNSYWMHANGTLPQIKWKELGEGGSTGNENEWEARKVGRRKNFLVRRIELAKHFIRTNINPEWMVLCLLPVLPPELRSGDITQGLPKVEQ